MINVGIILTSSNVFAKNALKNPSKLKRLDVKNTNKNQIIGCTISIGVKKRAIIITIVAIRNPLTIPPEIYQRIIAQFGIGEVRISSILLWNFAQKKELDTLLKLAVIKLIMINHGTKNSIYGTFCMSQIWEPIKVQKIKKYKVVVTTGGKIVCFHMRNTLFVSFVLNAKTEYKREFIYIKLYS